MFPCILGEDETLRALFPFKWAETHIRYLTTNIPRSLHRTFSLNVPPLLKTDLANWHKGLFSWFGWVNIIKMTALPNVLYRLQTLPVQIPSTVFKELNRVFSHFIWVHKAPQILVTTLRLPKHLVGVALPEVQLYYWVCHLTRILDWCRHSSQTVGVTRTGICPCWPEISAVLHQRRTTHS